MTPLEHLEDQYPELKFWGIEVNNPHYHGHIEGLDVYINLLQPDYDHLETALHEIYHHEFDYGDLSNLNDIQVLKEEGYASRYARGLVVTW